MSLINSVYRRDLSAMKRLLAEGTDVNVKDTIGRTALWYASEGKPIEYATVLIDAKADVNEVDTYGYTPLHRASYYYNHVECVRLLIQHKANVNISNKFGNSPLHYASNNKSLACVQILVAAGAENDQPNNDGETLLAIVIAHNHPAIAKYLFHSGAKLKNVHPKVKIPDWMHKIVANRCNTMSFTLTLKGVLKWRFGLCKDVTHLIALCFWRMRLK